MIDDDDSSHGLLSEERDFGSDAAVEPGTFFGVSGGFFGSCSHIARRGVFMSHDDALVISQEMNDLTPEGMSWDDDILYHPTKRKTMHCTLITMLVSFVGIVSAIVVLAGKNDTVKSDDTAVLEVKEEVPMEPSAAHQGSIKNPESHH